MDHNAIADVLDGAADVIERDGWHQGGSGHGPGGAACAIVACANTAKELGLRDAIWLDATDVVRDFVGIRDTYTTIANWNDAPERIKQDVLDALRLAAKQERIAADAEAVSA